MMMQVFYIDNESEEMTLNTLDILVRNEQWRKQILLIQGYVPRKSLQTGNYSHAPQVIQHDIDDDAAAAADDDDCDDTMMNKTSDFITDDGDGNDDDNDDDKEIVIEAISLWLPCFQPSCLEGEIQVGCR
jgi:hypothetical protein